MLDKIIAFGINLRLTICSTSFPFLNLIIWMTTAVIFLLIATSVGKYIAAEADGSGIPEVKTVLSGMNIHRCFSVETFVAKSIGLLAALIGGIYYDNKVHLLVKLDLMYICHLLFVVD